MKKRPIALINKIREDLEVVSESERLWRYGTTDLNICAIMEYLNDLGDPNATT